MTLPEGRYPAPPSAERKKGLCRPCREHECRRCWGYHYYTIDGTSTTGDTCQCKCQGVARQALVPDAADDERDGGLGSPTRWGEAWP